MPTSEEFVQACLAQKGDRYVFAAETSPLDPNPSTWDCSELVQWAAARVHISPTVPDGAYYQWKHCPRLSVADGMRRRGALLFVGDGTGVGRDAITHVAVSLGDGTTIEARGRAWGVGTWGAAGRFGWAGTIPGLQYVPASPKPPTNQGGGIGIMPGSDGSAIKFLQSMLSIIRKHNKRSPITADGVYGNQTKAAVSEFQREWNQTFGGRLVITGGADPATCDAIAVAVKLILAA